MRPELRNAVRSLAGSTTPFEITDGLITNWDYAEVQTNVAQPTAEALATELTRLQGVYDALEYSRLRKAKYDLLNQDEMRYDDLVNNSTTWRDGIAAIKAAHPKP